MADVAGYGRRAESDEMSDGFSVPVKSDEGKEEPEQADTDAPDQRERESIDDREAIELGKDGSFADLKDEKACKSEGDGHADEISKGNGEFERDIEVEKISACQVEDYGRAACQQKQAELLQCRSGVQIA